MDYPKRFKQQNQVCKLNKYLYRLKQSPQVWNKSINEFFNKYNFHYTNSDHGIYINDQSGIIIGIWVDDLIIIEKNIMNIKELKENLNKTFEMKDLGDLTYFLGIHIIQNRKTQTIFINQSNYISKILTQFNMQDCKPAKTPLEPNIKISKSTEPEPYNLQYYQKAIENLMYAMLGTRPDIAYTVSVISQFHSNPNQTHWNILKQTFQYLKETIELGILYGNMNELKLERFSNSDWGENINSRKSTSRYIFKLGNGAISWSSVL